MPAPAKRIGPHFLHHPELELAPGGLSPRQRVMSLTAIIAAAFGIGLTFGIGAPLTALTFERWGEPNWLIGVAGAVPALAVLLILPFVPAVAARWGAVWTIIAGCLFDAVGFAAMFFFQSTAAWFVIRFLMSAGLALPWLVAETWMNTASLSHNRGRVIAAYAISFFLGFAAGPAILNVTGILGPWPFVVGAIGPFLAGIPILIAARFAPDMTHGGETLGVKAAMRLAPLGIAGGFIGGAVEMTYLALLANVGLAAGMDNASALRLLALLTLGGGLLQFGIGWLADAFNRAHVLLTLCAVFVALSVALPWAFNASLLAYAIAFLLGGVVLGFYTVGLAIIGDEVAPRYLTSVNAAFLIVYQIGGMIGPTLAGGAMTIAPVGGFVVSVSAIVILSALVIIKLRDNAAR